VAWPAQIYPAMLASATPAIGPSHPLEWPHKPWSRVHIEYTGPFLI